MIGEEGANMTERGDFETKIHDLTSTDETFCSNQQLNNQTVIDMNLQTQRKPVTKNQGKAFSNINANFLFIYNTRKRILSTYVRKLYCF